MAGLPVNNLVGIAWMVGTAVSLTAMYIAARQLSPGLSPFQIVLFRAGASLLILLPWLMRAGLKVLKAENHWLHAGRGLSTFGTISFLFYGVANAPLADAKALQAVYPCPGRRIAGRALWPGAMACGPGGVLRLAGDRPSQGSWRSMTPHWRY